MGVIEYIREILERDKGLPKCELTEIMSSSFKYVRERYNIFEFVENVCNEFGISMKDKDAIIAVVNCVKGGDVDWHNAWLFVKPKMYNDFVAVIDGMKETVWRIYGFVKVKDKPYIVVKVRSKLDVIDGNFSELEKRIKIKKPRIIADGTIITGFIVDSVKVDVKKYDPSLPPPEDRLYIKPEDLPKLPKKIKVYRGEKGGLFVSKKELKALLVEEGRDENVESYLREIGVRYSGREESEEEEGGDSAEFEFNSEEYLRMVKERLGLIRDEYSDKLGNIDRLSEAVMNIHKAIAKTIGRYGFNSVNAYRKILRLIGNDLLWVWNEIEDNGSLEDEDYVAVIEYIVSPIKDVYVKFIESKIEDINDDKIKTIYKKTIDYLTAFSWADSEFVGVRDKVDAYLRGLACIFGIVEYLTQGEKTVVIEVDKDKLVSVDIDVLDKFASEYNIPIYSASRHIVSMIEAYKEDYEDFNPYYDGKDIEDIVYGMPDVELMRVVSDEVIESIYGLEKSNNSIDILYTMAENSGREVGESSGFDWWREEGKRRFSIEFEFEGLDVVEVNEEYNLIEIAKKCGYDDDGSLSGFAGELKLSFLSGDKGYEFIEKFFKSCREKGKLINTERAGLHISVDVSDIVDKFDKRGRLALAVAWSDIANQLFNLGVLDESRWDNRYCIDVAGFEEDYKMIVKYLKGEIDYEDLVDQYFKVDSAIEEKYWAVAFHTLKSLGRVEFRQPDGMWINGTREKLLVKLCVELVNDFARDKEKFIEKVVNRQIKIENYLTPEEVNELKKLAEKLVVRMLERKHLIRAMSDKAKLDVLDRRSGRLIVSGREVKDKKIVDYAKKKGLKKSIDIVLKVLKAIGVIGTGAGTSVCNPTYRGSKRKKGDVVSQVNEEANMFSKGSFWFTTVVDEEDLEMLKAGFTLAIKRYAKSDRFKALLETDFWQSYARLSEEECKKVNEVLIKCVLDGSYLNKERVIERLMREVGIDRRQAETIATTELSNLANKVREIAYRERTRVKKFKWVTENDDRVCEKCKELAELTANGVTLDELKRLIKEVGGNTAREWIPHIGCRCTYIRYGEDSRYMRWWE